MSLLNLSSVLTLVAVACAGLGCGGASSATSESSTTKPETAAQASKLAAQAGAGSDEAPSRTSAAAPAASVSSSPSTPGVSTDKMDAAAGVDPKCAAGTFDSTFGAIQKVIFEGNKCTNDSCHGAAANGGLDLRPTAAYASLVEVASTISPLQRVMPGRPDESFLYNKLRAATNLAA